MGRGGIPRTGTAASQGWLGPRHRRILAWPALGIAVEGGLAGLTVLCFLLGARPWAAGFALALLAASPLLPVGPVQDWWRHRRPRRHRTRPADFPTGG